ncbi:MULTISPECIES: DUF1540 domain-containing protein [unclassified Micromonospora]|uniref:DUF1540 domain-containing protein n=1 Tax=unclassified Micromonospora TaxID=2617518 RepID=UPI001C242F5F|nr:MULTISPECIES: DUF1540 domain-containing protein [unclassified Micromonospora]MBU8861426.1 DUF1540 domain-containing protein [Micromonospora sp. WMMB482]MDM4780990.1 DUF1540 domain-containing protein [Micromonospora sp. b486]
MKTLLQSPPVRECAATACSFNDSGCHAPAITVAASADAASCATFVESSLSGGIAEVTGAVGACARAECVFNSNLACTAESITVGPGATVSDCLTYQPA